MQLSLFSPGNEIAETVKRIEIDNTTPMEALNLLKRLRDMANEQ
jgi:hypothetical protein